MRKRAWSLTELLVVFTVIGIILMISLPAVKNMKNNGDEISLVMAVDNFQKAHGEVLYLAKQNNEELNTNTYCTKITDTLVSNKSSCTQNPNITLLTGVTISGLTNNWINEKYKEITFRFKNQNYRFGAAKPVDNVFPIDNNETINKIFKYTVTKKEEYGVIPKTKKGVSFKEASCISGWSKFLGLENGSNNYCSGYTRDLQNCPNFYNCEIKIIMPKTVTNFGI